MEREKKIECEESRTWSEAQKAKQERRKIQRERHNEKDREIEREERRERLRLSALGHEGGRKRGSKKC